MKKIPVVIFTFFFLFSTKESFAQPGALDSSFGVNGKVTATFGYLYIHAWGAAAQQDKKIVTAGYIAGNFDSYDFIVARFLNNGDPDSSFGTNGNVITHFDTGVSEAIATSVITQPDGKIIVGGYVYAEYAEPNYFALARYMPDGDLDSGFGINGKVLTHFPGETEINVLTLQPDGKILAGGYSDGMAMARYKSNGVLDSSFGTNGEILDLNGPDVYDLMIQNNGKIIVAGVATSINGGATNIIRLLSNGSHDPTFGQNGVVTIDSFDYYDKANLIVLSGDGSIICAGTAKNSLIALVKYKDNGHPDSSFGTNGKVITKFTETGVHLRRVFLQQNGKLIISGSASSGNFMVARVNPNGAPDSTFGLYGMSLSDFGTEAYDAALQADGKIVVAGEPSFSLARFIGGDPPIYNIKAGNWSDPTVWSNGKVPDASEDIILNFDVIVDINATCKSLTTNGHSVHINPGARLDIAEL